MSQNDKALTRWEYSKQFSNYHFDPTINEDQDPHWKYLGRVEGDLAGIFYSALEQGKIEPNGFLNRLSVQIGLTEKPFTYEYDKAELEYLNLDPNHTFFDNLNCKHLEGVQKIMSAFHCQHAGATFHIQRPGQTFPFHIDEIPGVKNNRHGSLLDKHPKWGCRFEIPIFDWQPGHVWAVGNTYWKQWKAGDIFWHDWRNTPHRTANISRCDRVTLQITGLCSGETIEIIENGGLTIHV